MRMYATPALCSLASPTQMQEAVYRPKVMLDNLKQQEPIPKPPMTRNTVVPLKIGDHNHPHEDGRTRSVRSRSTPVNHCLRFTINTGNFKWIVSSPRPATKHLIGSVIKSRGDRRCAS